MEQKKASFTIPSLILQVVLSLLTFSAFASSAFLVQRWLYPPPAFTEYPADTIGSRLVAYGPSWCVEEACPPGSPSQMNWLNERLPWGSVAPDLELGALAGEETFRLSSYRKVKPVVMVFGSFTCDRFQQSIPGLNRLYQQNKDQVAFAFIAVPEAGHTIPGFEDLLSDHIHTLAMDGHYQARRERIERARKRAGLLIPGFFDPPDHEACRTYRAWPARLIVVDTEGCVTNDFGAPIPQNWPMDQIEKIL